MKKLLLYSIWIVSLFSIFYLCNISDSFASTLSTSKKIYYSVSETGGLSVKYELFLNNTSKDNVVISSYRFPVPFTQIENPKLNIDGKESLFKKSQTSSQTEISIVPTSYIIKPKSKSMITLSFTLSNYTSVGNEIKQITVPAKTISTENTDIFFNYPKYWGEILKSTSIYNYGNGYYQYLNIDDNYIEISIGESLIYEYNITKKIENEYDQPYVYLVNIPTSTNRQKVYISSISHTPNTVVRDDSNNITYYYILEKGQSIDLEIKISIVIQNDQKKISEIDTTKYLVKKGYWDLKNKNELDRLNRYFINNGYNDSSIENVTDDKLNEFYRLSYYYIIDRLEPQRNSLLQNYSSRRGLENIIKDRNNSSVEDYNDFTIALFRYLKIPTRLMIGYVPQTEKQTGYYHSWVEYYNENEQHWISIDPYLEDMSKKVIYNSILNDRIVISIRDIDPINPQIQYLMVDEFISKISDSNAGKFNNLSIDTADIVHNNSQEYSQLSINIENKGNNIIFIRSIAIYDKDNNIIERINNEEIILSPTENRKIMFNLESTKLKNRDEVRYIIEYADNNSEEYREIKTMKISTTDTLLDRLLFAILVSSLIFGTIYVVRRIRRK